MRRWLVVAAAPVVLSFAASAAPAHNGSKGFDWWYVAVGGGAVVAVGGSAIARARAQRRWFEGLVH